MLLSVLFIMLIMSSLMAAMVTLSNQSSQQLVYETQALRARLAAESLLQRKVFELLDDINALAPVEDVQINQCQAEVVTGETKDLEDTGTRQVSVIATGECRNGRLTIVRNIEVEVIE